VLICHIKPTLLILSLKPVTVLVRSGLRGFVSRRLDIMRKAFITYIRPILEYNCLVWNPCQVHSIDLLENVQRNSQNASPPCLT
jgi:hypothetical protein